MESKEYLKMRVDYLEEKLYELEEYSINNVNDLITAMHLNGLFDLEIEEFILKYQKDSHEQNKQINRKEYKQNLEIVCGCAYRKARA